MFMKRWSLLFMALVLVSSPAFGSIIGDTIQVEWNYPILANIIFTGSTTVPGSVFPGSGVSEINIADGTIIVTNTTDGWQGALFNGFIFTDLSTVPNFTSLQLVSVTGFPPPIDPILSFDADHLSINFDATGSDNIGSGLGQVYTFSYTYGAAAPLPGSLILLLSGLAALTGLRTKLKK
jgi:hypothetical protein